MSTTDQVAAIVDPIVAAAGAQLYDVEYNGGVLRVSIDRDGGVDVDLIAEVSRAVSRALDEADPIPGTYTLEVSSPGIERKLRVPAHFRAAVGETVQLKLRPGVTGDRRIEGTIVSATDLDVTVDVAGEQHTIPTADITRAQVLFDWDAAPKERPASNERNEATS